MWREFTTPWAPDARVERFATERVEELQQLAAGDQLGRSFGNGVFARANGSPYAPTKIPDLMNLRYNRYLDATGTHRRCQAEGRVLGRHVVSIPSAGVM